MFANLAENYLDQGYVVLPCMPGHKVPGKWDGKRWSFMNGWQTFADTQPTQEQIDGWSEWPNAGLCVLHNDVCALDVDTDDQDVMDAVKVAMPGSPAKRRGKKGFAAYFRTKINKTARIKWVDAEGKTVVELLLKGTQSVLPPTIHPETNEPYIWLTPDALCDVPKDDLPELTGDHCQKLTDMLAVLGIKLAGWQNTAQQPKETTARDLNNMALSRLGDWLPQSGLYNLTMRGPDLWHCVPTWRQSSTGQSVENRKPSLKISPQGIYDFGGGYGMSACDVIMAAKDLSFQEAARWLEQQLGIKPREVKSPGTVGQESKGKAFGLVPSSAIELNYEARDFVEGLLCEGDLSVVYGPSNVGKSFWALDLGWAIGRGENWRWKQCDLGDVIYCPLEGQGGVPNRMASLKADRGESRLWVCTELFDLLGESWQDLAEGVKGLEAPKLIIIDTLARALGGGDENSLTDMGRVIASCNNLSKATGAHVMLIHHSGKDEEKGMRGHSSLKAAADTVIKITKPDRGNPYTEAQVEKQKDLPIGNAMPFALRDVHLGSDSKGRSLTSCLIKHSNVP